MKKELRAVHDIVSCDVCGRTILKGERTEWYLAPGGHRHKVCDLCAVRAQHTAGSASRRRGEMPTAPGPQRPEPRRARPPAAPARRGSRAPGAGGGLGSGRRRGVVRPTGCRRCPRSAPARAAALTPQGSAPRAGRSHHRGGEGRPGARPLQRLRSPAHGRGPGAHAGPRLGERPARSHTGERGHGARRLGDFVVSLSGGSGRRGRPRGDARQGRGARTDRGIAARMERRA